MQPRCRWPHTTSLGSIQGVCKHVAAAHSTGSKFDTWRPRVLHPASLGGNSGKQRSMHCSPAGPASCLPKLWTYCGCVVSHMYITSLTLLLFARHPHECSVLQICVVLEGNGAAGRGWHRPECTRQHRNGSSAARQGEGASLPRALP